MNKIHIKRNPSFFGMARKMKIFTDGQHTEDVKNEKTTTIEVQEGVHQIQVGMDWCKSNKIELTTEEGVDEYLSIDTIFFPVAILFSILYPPGVFKLKNDKSNQAVQTTRATARV
tara:strand:- start:58 stop:402 length:345 start_codon:yes stop_codon:yes gene_type:complete